MNSVKQNAFVGCVFCRLKQFLLFNCRHAVAFPSADYNGKI